MTDRRKPEADEGLAEAAPLWRPGDAYPDGWIEIPEEWLAVKNPRAGKIEMIAESIRESGWFGRVVIQRHSKVQKGPRILIGNHRYRAGRMVDMERFPVEVVDCDDKAGDRILIADNRTSDIAGWNDEALYVMLEDLQLSDMLDGTGFTAVDLEALRLSLDPPIDEEGGPKDNGPKIMIGLLRAPVERDEVDQWMAELVGEVGGNYEDQVAEVKRRLGWP